MRYKDRTRKWELIANAGDKKYKVRLILNPSKFSIKTDQLWSSSESAIARKCAISDTPFIVSRQSLAFTSKKNEANTFGTRRIEVGALFFLSFEILQKTDELPAFLFPDGISRIASDSPSSRD